MHRMDGKARIAFKNVSGMQTTILLEKKMGTRLGTSDLLQ